MNDITDPLNRLLADLERIVEGASAGADGRRFVAGLSKLRYTVVEAATQAAPFGLPVCRFWETALQAAEYQEAPPDIVGSLGCLGLLLTWAQNPNYRQAPPTADFLDNYGYAVIAGPADGPPALLRHSDCALGVLLLGPETHYPRHHHPAAEIYVPLAAAQWWRDGGPWRREPAGAVIHHASGVPHATRTTALPLIALYLWTGELETHARLVTDA